MKKVVVLGIDLSDSDKDKIGRANGEVIYQDTPTSADDFLAKTKNADVIYSGGDFLLENLTRLENVFVTYPYIELGEFDSAELEKRGVYVANARGGNKNSIVEWVIFMALALFRNFIGKVRAAKPVPFERTKSLEGKRALVVGHGDIGSEVGRRLSGFSMEVDFYNRGDNLLEKAGKADLIVDALNVNVSSKNLLDKQFFASLKNGAYFISFGRRYTYDLDGLISAIDAGVVAGAAIDCDPESSGDVDNDFYQTALACNKILVTPHIAFAADVAGARGHEIAIENIVSFLNGVPKNVITK